MSYSEQINAIKDNLRDLFPATPLQYSKFLSDRYGANIYLKREDLTPVRSYKIRGAFTFIRSYLEEHPNHQPSNGADFVCASLGNHAQGVAFACKFFEKKGIIFMPVTAPEQKLTKTRVAGGDWIEIRQVGDTFNDAYDAANQFAKENKILSIPPFDHPWTIDGDATIGAEILDQMEGKHIDTVISPVGGGGILSGTAKYLTEVAPDIRIIGADPAGSACLVAAFDAGRPVTLEGVSTFVDGASVSRVGDHNWAIIKDTVKAENVWPIPENRIPLTMLDFLHHEGIILEPAGALSIDALKDFKKEEIKGKTIVCIISGGNFDFERLPEVKERAMKYKGTKKYFVLRLPQRPGALREFLECLGEGDDIARFEYLKKSSKTFGSILIGIETTEPENFPRLFKALDEAGFEYKDVTEDEVLADFII